MQHAHEARWVLKTEVGGEQRSRGADSGVSVCSRRELHSEVELYVRETADRLKGWVMFQTAL